MSHRTRDLAFMAAAKKSVVQSPGDLGSSLLDWWRAYDLGLSDGTNIGSWTGHVNGVVATQGSGSAQPDYRTGIINALPVARFVVSGQDDSLPLPSELANRTNLAMAVVVKNLGVNGGSAAPCFLNSKVSPLNGYWGIEASTKLMKLKNSAGTIYTSGAALAGSLTAATMLAVIITGGNIKFYEKNNLLSTVAHAADFSLGRFGDFGPADADMDLAEVVIVDGVLAEQDLFDMYTGYFQPTYAL